MPKLDKKRFPGLARAVERAEGVSSERYANAGDEAPGEDREAIGSCELCGRVIYRKTGTPGRYASVHRRCRKLSNQLGWIESELEEVGPRITKEKKSELRRYFWYLANLLNRTKPLEDIGDGR